jgi:cellulose synthase operon protein C
MKSAKLFGIALAFGGLCAGHQVAAQPKEVQLERGPASDLYLRKRPLAPEAPLLSSELKRLLQASETKRDAKRLEAIALLRAFIDSNPGPQTRADGVFKLAELLWEESRRQYLEKMEVYSRASISCGAAGSPACAAVVEPRIDLHEPEKYYQELHDRHPDFRRADLVTYLLGFAAKEDNREAKAMTFFQEVITDHPTSPLYGDAWMMVGEHHFAALDWDKARAAYANILLDKTSATYDLAMFKTAWCDWKLGDVDTAARRFKEVLDLAVEADRSGTASQRRRRAGLKEEALEYLVVVFTEDKSISAKEVFDFLASIGGERYSLDVLVKVAESYSLQDEFVRSNDAYRFLISMDADAIRNAQWHRQIVENSITAADPKLALTDLKALLDGYGPDSAWAKAQQNREALTRSIAATEELARSYGTNLHGAAQQDEKASKKPDVQAYTSAAAAYAVYLDAFGKGKKTSDKAAEVRFYHAEILYFKLGKIEEAGDEYLTVGRSTPVGELHKDALLKAMKAFESARPKDTIGKRQLLPVDKKFADAVDLYATLFPADPELVGVIFRNGQLFYDYGDYDGAIKRFGVIVTKYPDHPDAGPAGDRILAALSKAQDYENIEDWARRLKKAKAFAAKDQQERLDRLIVESIDHSGQKYSEAGKYDEAATFYVRIAKEFPSNKLAAQSLMNAGVMYEKGKRPQDAADVYLQLAQTYATSNADLAEKAAFAAAQVYEKFIYYDRAAAAYEVVASKFAKGSKVADAVYNAGLLRQALGEHQKAIAHYQDYSKRFRERKDAADVAFNIGVVYEDAGDDGRADQAFRDYARTFAGTNRHIIESHVRSGRASLRLGQQRRAKDEFAAALAVYKRAAGKEKADGKAWAAEARYNEGELIFKDFEAVSLDVKPSALEKALSKKGQLLADAQKVYLNVVEFGDAKWATAALYRVGQIFDGFAESLVTASTPAGLSEADKTAYRDALDLYVVKIQDSAVERFTAGYQKAISLQVYDQYTVKIRESLARLASDQFPPEREARGKARVADKPIATSLVTEVAR